MLPKIRIHTLRIGASANVNVLAIAIATPLAFLTTAAQADVTISSGATMNMTCSGGVCSPTAKDAVLNVEKLEDMLASGSVEVTTGNLAKELTVTASLTWATSNTLTLDAFRSISIDNHVAIKGAGTLDLITNDGGTGGRLAFGNGGRVTFANLAAALTINGTSYTLLNNLATLASDVAADPIGDFALTRNYNASADGTYAASPIPTAFTGTFEGLGNSISNLTISDVSAVEVGLFAEVDKGGNLRDIGLVKANVAGLSVGPCDVGALAAVNYGVLDNDFVTGILVGGYGNYAGALVGINYLGGNIFNSHASNTVTSGYRSYTGGLVGKDYGTITSSYATGMVNAGYRSSIGGLVGKDLGTITFSYATGMVKAGYRSYTGGLVGKDYGAIASSYATGTANDGYSSDTGALVGYNRGTIDQSFATGAGNSGYSSHTGGLVGYNSSAITNAYATGAVTAVGASSNGGLVGYNDGTIAYAYSTGAATGDGSKGSYVGGLIGFDTSSLGSLSDTYWDTTTSGIGKNHGAGNIPNDPGIKGKTTAKLQLRLPRGFSKKVWGEDSNINGGLPYLLANPPPS